MLPVIRWPFIADWWMPMLEIISIPFSLLRRFVDCITCRLARGSFPSDLFLLQYVEASCDIQTERQCLCLYCLPFTTILLRGEYAVSSTVAVLRPTCSVLYNPSLASFTASRLLKGRVRKRADALGPQIGADLSSWDRYTLHLLQLH